MSLGLSFVAFALAAFICLGMSWVFISKLEMVGDRFGFSEAILGLLAALAADVPEITSSVTALAQHQRAISAGVVIGSNVFNLAALLGLGAVVAGRIDLHRKVVLLGGAVAISMASLCLVSVVRVTDPPVGLGLALAVLVSYVAILAVQRNTLGRLPLPRQWVRRVASAVDEEELELALAIRPRPARPRDTVVAVATLVVVVGAAITMERAASTLGAHFAVPGIVIGGLVLAAVTSLPNAVSAVYLASKGRGAAALSTALNSNTVNVVAGFLFPASVLGLARPSGPTVLVAGSYVGLTVLTLVFAYIGRGLSRWTGVLIVVAYVAFVVSLVAVS